jgi:putative FmdB family regulatory protein
MPIYDFECVKCNHAFECFMKVGQDQGNLTCPECGAAHPKKIVSRIQTPDFKRLGQRILERMAKRNAGE